MISTFATIIRLDGNEWHFCLKHFDSKILRCTSWMTLAWILSRGKSRWFYSGRVFLLDSKINSFVILTPIYFHMFHLSCKPFLATFTKYFIYTRVLSSLQFRQSSQHSSGTKAATFSLRTCEVIFGLVFHDSLFLCFLGAYIPPGYDFQSLWLLPPSCIALSTQLTITVYGSMVTGLL